jgi:HD-GYP domain-containing protein (c-di-GMP phosphodiesterase class II)
MRPGLRERAAPILAFGGSAAAAPALLLHFFGRDAAAIDGGWHFFGVGMSALAAAVAALLLTAAGARRNDGRTVLVGTAFAAMAALLGLHGLATPGFLVGMNGVVALTGAATLPVGGAILALSALPSLRRPRRLKPLIALEAGLMLAILALGLAGLLEPTVVPSVPEPGSTPALVALAAGSAFYLLVGLRALGTFALTRRTGDLIVAIGIAWLGAALPAALLLSYRELGWWLGHGFELAGLVLVGAPVALDLFRTAQSRPLAGDLHAAELVAAEEVFLGAHVRALTLRLARKDEYTEEHTRRVALRAVQVGEELGLPPGRLRALAIGGLMHDIGKLSVPDSVLKKPAELTAEEFALVRRHPEWGDRLVADLGGFTTAVRRLVRDHHERLDGSGYPRGVGAAALEVDTRVLAVCDVYDALISNRVYRGAWSHDDALALLHHEAGVTLDAACVEALERVLARELESAAESAARPATSARRARTRPATPAAETS